MYDFTRYSTSVTTCRSCEATSRRVYYATRGSTAASLLRDAAQLKALVLVLSLPPASPRELIDVYVCYTSIHVCFLWDVLLAANPSYAYATLGRAPNAPSLTVAFIPRLSSFFDDLHRSSKTAPATHEKIDADVPLLRGACWQARLGKPHREPHDGLVQGKEEGEEVEQKGRGPCPGLSRRPGRGAAGTAG